MLLSAMRLAGDDCHDICVVLSFFLCAGMAPRSRIS
jgi:hypothetical protein